MKILMLEIHTSNMAGDFWSEQYWLKVDPKGGFKLRHGLDILHSEQDIPDIEKNHWIKITDGADLYDSLENMLNEYELSIHEQNIEEIASKIAELNPELAKQFLNAPNTLEQRHE